MEILWLTREETLPGYPLIPEAQEGVTNVLESGPGARISVFPFFRTSDVAGDQNVLRPDPVLRRVS